MNSIDLLKNINILILDFKLIKQTKTKKFNKIVFFSWIFIENFNFDTMCSNKKIKSYVLKPSNCYDIIDSKSYNLTYEYEHTAQYNNILRKIMHGGFYTSLLKCDNIVCYDSLVTINTLIDELQKINYKKECIEKLQYCINAIKYFNIKNSSTVSHCKTDVNTIVNNFIKILKKNKLFISGMDVSYSKDLLSGYAVIVIYDYDSFLCGKDIDSPKSLYTFSKKVYFKKPASLETFVQTETELYKKLLDNVNDESFGFYPDILLIDGYGNMIENNVATKIGKLTNLPTIGIAKQHHILLPITKQYANDQFHMHCKKKGEYIFIKNNNENIVGAIMKPTDIACGNHCMYISVGYKITLEYALEIIINLKNVKKYNFVEPLRVADQIGRHKLFIENSL